MAEPALKTNDLPPVRGRITENAPLGAVGWFKTGGTADVLFKPADREDLIGFLQNLPPAIPVQIFGVMSNCIIRDGGVRGVTIRLPRDFAKVEVLEGNRIRAGALALDASVANAAAEAGIAGLEFFSGIPGTIGGALRMNAGCYGTETKDVLVNAEAIDRNGKLYTFACHPESQPKDLADSEKGPGGMKSFPSTPDAASLRKQGSQAVSEQDPCLRRDALHEAAGVEEMTLSYRHNSLPEDFFFLEAIFEGRPGDPEEIKNHMAGIRARREDSQPIRERTGGSTFANPAATELSQAGLGKDTKVWQLIDEAGCRGLQIGGARMSEKHCNFMINTGTATAADLENLGEEVRRRVAGKFGITLRWEIKRMGERV